MKNEDLQQLVFESLGGCSWEYDLLSDRIFYSREFFELLGYRPDELEIDTDWVAGNIHPADLSQWRASFVSCIKGSSKYFDCELRFRHRDDHYVWIQTRGVVTRRDDQGRALGVTGLVFDISERKSAKENESRYRLFLDNIPDALSLKDREGRYLYINRQFEEWLGKPPHQIYGRTADEIFHPDTKTLGMLRQHERQVWEQGETIAMERQFPLTDDGAIRHAVITKFPVFDESRQILAIGTTNTDVTERYRAQQALQASEQRYRQLFESAPVILVESDWSKGKALIDDLRAAAIEDIQQHLIDHPELLGRRDQVLTVVNANEEALRVYKAASVAEFAELMARELNDEQRQSTIEDLVNFAAGERRSSVHTVSFRQNGEEFPIVREAELRGSNPDDWSRVLITVRDNSAEEAIRQSEKHLRQLFELAPAVLAESDWSTGKALIEDLRQQGVEDLTQHLIDHPELTRRRDQIMKLTGVNQEALRIYRADSAETLIRHTAGEMNEVQRLGMIEDLVNFANGQRRSSVQCRTFRVTGEEFPMIAESEFYGADPDDWSRVLLTIKDTSAEEAVRLSEQRYRRLFESAPAVLCETDWSKGKALVDSLRQQGVTDIRQHLIDHPQLMRRQDQVMKLLAVNHETLQIYRAEDEAALVDYAESELSEIQRLSLIDELCILASGQRRSTIQSRNWRLDGEEFPVVRVVEIYSDDPEDWSQVMLTVRDTSAEEAVRVSEKRYRQLFELAPAVLGQTDWSSAKRLVDSLRDQGIEDIEQHLIDHPELTSQRSDFMYFVDVNQEALRVYRSPSKESMIRFLSKPLMEEVRLGLIKDLMAFFNGETRSTIRALVPCETGEMIPIIRVSELSSSDPGDWSQVLISIRDISAEEAVRMSEMRYRRLFESAPVALYESDWSKGKALVDNLIEQGVEDIAAYLIEHSELLRQRADVLQILNCNNEAHKVYRAETQQQLIELIEGPVNTVQRDALISTLESFAAGRRRSSVRGFSARADGEKFPMIRDSELISSNREDWSRVLSSIHDLTAEVETANQLRDYQEQLRSLAGKISSAEEGERRRISSELHDGTIQNLVLARIHLANLRTTLDSGKGEQLADSINDLLETSLRETRSLIFEISPPVLYELGLEPAVEWLAEHYKQRSGIAVGISSDERSTKLAQDMNIVVFQSARELLVNVAKHAQAKKVSINWQHNDDNVVLSVEDDGIGFDADSPRVKLATEGGFGLFAVKERLNLLGAELKIESSDQGTCVTITAPVDTAQTSLEDTESR